MQTELTEGQLETFKILSKYEDGTAERYREFCFNGGGVIAKRAPKRDVPKSKICLECGAVFTRKPRESGSNFLKRLGCSKECSTAAGVKLKRERALKVKTCEVCDQIFTRGETEAQSKFLARKTCSRSCGYSLAASSRSKEFRHSRLKQEDCRAKKN